MSPSPAGAPAEPIRVAAAAKLNLYLHALGRRADGYHLLDSLVAFASVHDTIEVQRADRLSLALDGPNAAALGDARDNLVLRAAERLAARAGIPPRAAIRLTKRLPVASGIGGGSADAAATLRALMRLWKLDLDAGTLASIALELGADVPMCLLGRAAFAGGVGADLTPVAALPEAGLLLVNPGIGLSTASVFKTRAGAFSKPARFEAMARDAAGLAALLAERRNDLEAPARTLCPEVGAVLEALRAAPGARLARMSGSGATCFALFDDEDRARRAAPVLARPGWWIAPARLLSETATLAPD
ncbi:MAG TPA: 4-(cytidine 5'-diphospho)-2-C-methyl-D-erythritol kinase [Alphaproteobacteria bacterium]|nr:4-(cytidine 5'-diphospho)-2-C-methyl-D-erythritol kinase [Alphaproteobacteria bacterium]